MIEICVDNFAGGGGASQGIEAALGRPIDYAINHDREAIAMHKANHPRTKHLTEDVWKVDPFALTQGRRVALGWFSPDCTFHSKARGGKPFRDRNVARRLRGLAWVVVRWAKLPEPIRPRLIMLENVEEFADWGPLLEDGTPCPLRKGFTFRRWWKQLENLGYQVEMRELRACDYGAPTTRKRLFIIARCDGHPIVWPARTHGFEFLPYRTAAECIDWSIPCPSIFDRKRPLAEKTMRRIARGIMRYIVNNPRPFIVPLTHHGSDRVNDANERFRTITGAHCNPSAQSQRWARSFIRSAPTLIQTGYGEREGQLPRCLDIQRPLGTVVGQGNKHAMVTAFLARHFGNSIGQPVNAPAPTTTGNGGGKSALVTSHIIKLKGTCRDGQAADEPIHTIQASGLHFGEVRAFLLKYYGTEQAPRLERPLGVITTKDRFGLVTVHGEQYSIADIGMRMLTPRELFRAQGFNGDYIIDPVVEDKKGRLKPLTKTAQIRMCGNSVCPPVAEALVRANYIAQRAEAAA
jgi:DNA (cytosine-5)-methyltransferase 1